MTAADQTPATDSERDERPTYEEVTDAYQAHYRAGREMHAALLDIWRMAEPGDTKHMTYRDPSDVAMSVRALLAEQAATIEAVEAALADDRKHIGKTHGGVRLVWLMAALRTALGSQRTEGQG